MSPYGVTSPQWVLSDNEWDRSQWDLSDNDPGVSCTMGNPLGCRSYPINKQAQLSLLAEFVYRMGSGLKNQWLCAPVLQRDLKSFTWYLTAGLSIDIYNESRDPRRRHTQQWLIDFLVASWIGYFRNYHSKPHLWQTNINSGKRRMSLGYRLLPEAMLTTVTDVIWYH